MDIARNYGFRMMTVPLEHPDARTSLADLRTALCIASGVDLDDIDPAAGHDHSLSAYLSVRDSWARMLAESDDWWSREHSENARAIWQQLRPKYLAEHPWPELITEEKS